MGLLNQIYKFPTNSKQIIVITVGIIAHFKSDTGLNPFLKCSLKIP